MTLNGHRRLEGFVFFVDVVPAPVAVASLGSQEKAELRGGSGPEVLRPVAPHCWTAVLAVL